MDAQNVVRLQSSSKTKKARRATRANRALRRQAVVATCVGSVAVLITALSLSHLANGVRLITGCEQWEAWAMSIAIDVGFIATKFCTLVVAEKLHKKISTLANVTIVGTLAGSAAMNVYAFAAQASNVYILSAAIALGLAIPALIFAFMRLGAALWFDCQNRN
jgi:hypothetical protein